MSNPLQNTMSDISPMFVYISLHHGKGLHIDQVLLKIVKASSLQGDYHLSIL